MKKIAAISMTTILFIVLLSLGASGKRALISEDAVLEYETPSELCGVIREPTNPAFSKEELQKDMEENAKEKEEFLKQKDRFKANPSDGSGELTAEEQAVMDESKKYYTEINNKTNIYCENAYIIINDIYNTDHKYHPSNYNREALELAVKALEEEKELNEEERFILQVFIAEERFALSIDDELHIKIMAILEEAAKNISIENYDMY